MIFRIAGEVDVEVSRQWGMAGKPWSSDATNIMAEYTALIEALKYLQDNVADRQIEIIGDSQPVIGQLIGSSKVKSARIRRLHELVVGLLENNNFRWRAQWIRREENALADSLSRRAYEKFCIEHYGQPKPPPHWIAKYDHLQGGTL